MGSPETHPNGLNMKKKKETNSGIIQILIIISLTLLVFGSAQEEVREKKKVVLGSRPPGCWNECFGCKPCRAALVISSRHRSSDMAASAGRRDQEGYYLLSWECKCGNKLFDP